MVVCGPHEFLLVLSHLVGAVCHSLAERLPSGVSSSGCCEAFGPLSSVGSRFFFFGGSEILAHSPRDGSSTEIFR